MNSSTKSSSSLHSTVTASGNPPKAMLDQESQDPNKYFDAVIHTSLEPELLARPIIIATVCGAKDNICKPKNITMGTLYRALGTHEEGPKDGSAFIFADTVAGRRTKSACKAQTAVCFDIDNGTPVSEVLTAVAKSGFTAMVYTTHSHGKTQTEINRDKLVRFAGEKNIEDDEIIGDYLRKEKGFHEAVANTATYSETVHTSNGIVVIANHASIDKTRVFFPLFEAFSILREGKTQSEAHAKWAKVLKALGALLNLYFDEACIDPLRIFYLPRHDKGSPYEAHVFGGQLLDWKTLDLDDFHEKLAVEMDRGKSKSTTPEGRALGGWVREYGHTFQVADAFEAYAPDKVRRYTGAGNEIECPFDENHTNAGDPEDSACFAVNAGEGPSPIAAITCHHQSCRMKTMPDMVGKAVADGTLPKSALTDPEFHVTFADDAKTPAVDEVEIRRNAAEKAVGALNKNSTREQVREVVAKIAILPKGLDADDMVRDVARLTGKTASALRDEIANERKHQKRPTREVTSFPSEHNAPKSAKITALEAEIPLPGEGHGNFMYVDFEGRPWLCRVGSAVDADDGFERLHTPCAIKAGIVNADHGNARSLRVAIQNEDGLIENVDVPVSAAVQSYGSLLKTKLREMSVAWTEKGEAFLVSQFKQNSPPNPIVVYDRPGWHGTAFLTAWGTVINTKNPIELSAEGRPKGKEVEGTLDDWKVAIAAAYDTGVLQFQLAPLLGFASPLIDLLNYPSMVIDLTGESSQGKSMSQEIAASVYGDPAPKAGLVRTFNATVKSAEALLQKASGSLLVVDEVKLADDRDIQQFIFMVGSDTGADRLDRNANLKAARDWNVLVVISDEQSLAERIKRSEKSVTTGVTTRSLDINVDGTPSLSSEVIATINGYKKNFGHAGSAYVRQIVDSGYAVNPEKLDAEVQDLIIELVGRDAPAQLRRAARIVAILWKAGIIAQSAALIPADADVAGIARRAWEKALESETAPSMADDRAVQALFENLLTRRGADISECVEKQLRAASAWRLDDFVTYGSVYVVPFAKLQALAGGALGAKAVSRILAKRGLIIPSPRSDKKSNAWDYVPGVGGIRSLIIPSKFVEDDVKPESGSSTGEAGE